MSGSTGAPSVGELLHFGAVALAISIAYVGLDRVSGERNAFYRTLRQATSAAKDILIRHDCYEEDGNGTKTQQIQDMISTIGYSGMILRLQKLMTIAASKTNVRRICNAMSKQSGGKIYQVSMWDRFTTYWGKTPMLGYFRRAWDRVAVSTFAVVGIFLYVLTVGGIIWEIEFFSTSAWVKFCFAFYVILTVWIFGTVGCSFRLAKLRAYIQECDRLINDRITAALRGRVLDRLQAAPGSTGQGQQGPGGAS
jgi:hypothetical protein